MSDDLRSDVIDALFKVMSMKSQVNVYQATATIAQHLINTRPSPQEDGPAASITTQQLDGLTVDHTNQVDINKPLPQPNWWDDLRTKAGLGYGPGDHLLWYSLLPERQREILRFADAVTESPHDVNQRAVTAALRAAQETVCAWADKPRAEAKTAWAVGRRAGMNEMAKRVIEMLGVRIKSHEESTAQ